MITIGSCLPLVQFGAGNDSTAALFGMAQFGAKTPQSRGFSMPLIESTPDWSHIEGMQTVLSRWARHCADWRPRRDAEIARK